MSELVKAGAEFGQLSKKKQARPVRCSFLRSPGTEEQEKCGFEHYLSTLATSVLTYTYAQILAKSKP